ncbi:hypothetical protein ACUH92_08860 [Dermabacteraceae bacterium CCM 9520]
MSILDTLLTEKQSLALQTMPEPICKTRSIAEIFTLLEGRDYTLCDTILHTLLQRGPEDSQAREILLYAMLPALSSVAATYKKATQTSADEALLTAIECFYEAIQSPTLRAKETKVAARIKGSVLSLLLSQSKAHKALSTTSHPLEDIPAGLNGAAEQPPGSLHSALDLLEALSWAHSYNVISQDEVKFLLAIYSPELAHSLRSEVGLDTLKPATVRKRASRLVKKIAQAVIHKELDLSEAAASIY